MKPFLDFIKTQIIIYKSNNENIVIIYFDKSFVEFLHEFHLEVCTKSVSNVVEIVVEKNKPIENQWVMVLKCGIGGNRTPVRRCDS